MTVTRALIPCGGRGVRMLSLTHGSPKELIDVAGTPVLVRVLRECAESGIREALIVIAPGKDQIVDVVSPLAGTPGMPRAISFVVQHEPRGLADAIRMGRDFAAGTPLAVALPDNLFDAKVPATRQVIDTYLATRQNVVAVVEIFAADASARGPTSIYSGELNGDEFRITRLPGKGERSSTFDTGGAASAFTGIGRFVFDENGFNAIDEVARTLHEGAELDDVPVMQLLLSKNELVGRRIAGRFFDVGLVPGYREANEAFSAASLTR